MHKAAQSDEPVCLTCMKPLSGQLELSQVFLGKERVCPDCRTQRVWKNKTGIWNGKKIIVLFENNEWMETFWKRYALLNDTALAPVLLEGKMKKVASLIAGKGIVAESSPDILSAMGHLPVETLFSCYGYKVWHPQFAFRDQPADNSKIYLLKEPFTLIVSGMEVLEKTKSTWMANQADCILVLKATKEEMNQLCKKRKERSSPEIF